MDNQMQIDVSAILHEPYWSYEEIINVAMHKKFPTYSNNNDSADIVEFKADLLKMINEAILHRNIRPVDFESQSNWCVRNAMYIEPAKFFVGAFALMAITYFGQKHLNASPAVLKEFKAGYDPSHFFEDIVIHVAKIVFSLFFTLFFAGYIIWLSYKGILKFNSSTPRKKIKYLSRDAKDRGFTDKWYESESVIDFLNYKYALNVEKDPFRVWKEPFFKRNGEIWIVGYQGRRVCLKDEKVTEKIAYLLDNPNKEYSALDFVKGNPDELTAYKDADRYDADQEYQKCRNEMSYQGVTKEKALELLEILDAQRKDAAQDGSPEKILDCESQSKLIKRYIDECFTMDGKEKLDRDEKIRSQESLEKAIKRFISKLKDMHPPLAEHLKCIRKSSIFSYRPPDDIRWEVRY